MLEGLAVWALFIYLLRLVGMPWNKFTKAFSYLGGAGWLVFVWIGLITFAPMDMSGGSVVQSPHIQLRPGSTKIKGHVDEILVRPNEKVKKGQLVYTLDDEQYQIALNKAQTQLDSANVALSISQEDVLIAEQNHYAALKDIEIASNEIEAAREDLEWKETTLRRYQKQNKAVKHTITETQMDEQQTAVDVARTKLVTLQSQLDKAKVSAHRAKLDFEKAGLSVESRKVDVANKLEDVAQAQWNLDNTRVYAPADGYLTNFIMREGQYVGVMPRIQMYTDEKYVLMRVNHQAIRNVKVGQQAEFASPVYPGKVFSAEVEGIIEATGEAQGSLLARDDNVRQMTGKNALNKHHFVRLKLTEPGDYDIPVGSVGLAWISAEKPIDFLAFLDVIRGIIIRMKSQIYFIWSM
ncbi:HlyD family secretion protein [Photobacterium gaetbulicola]|uniref:Putative multidrug resistance efflux pump n=1 Tax=Photobacterium gaetbulicola Gung47 TaxID=658445 RepID=A0A0C5WJJ4_9GAMM|nr:MULTISPECIES: efflux RND transporter periplasmic adaptor subunit [Photobacterium]AJR06382.1 putative multidrug resistance efflux pump [Photobacterium gaetbulicola Gung47]PSU05479.1 HlyD family secretion protein [Photobacterium gaetbulicola]WEM45194.1 efflux RND transporter periplasmic adaptor subunit [Photobacterium sp. DA100]